MLKEIVHFAKSTHMVMQAGSSSSASLQEKGGVYLSVLDAVMNHSIFGNHKFWEKYEQKLFDIVQR